MDADLEELNTPEHLLLTVLGTNPRDACYTLGTQEAEGALAPVALLELLPQAERPDRVLAICTPEAADESWPRLKAALEGRWAAERVDVSNRGDPAEIDAFLRTVTGAIPRSGPVALTVDVTHGFRHFSFLTYIAVLYLAALRRVEVRGTYYGLYGGGSDRARFWTFVRCSRLPRWVHALTTLEDTGSTGPMGRLLCKRGHRNQFAEKTAGNLSGLSEAYLAGLPLELGRFVELIRDQLRPLKKLLRREHRVPLASELVEHLREVIAPFALPGSVSRDGWKRNIELTHQELDRQAKLIDDLLKRDSIPTALRLMNEWTTSWVVLLTQDPSPAGSTAAEWLGYPSVRKKAANRLNAIRAIRDNSEDARFLTGEQRRLGSFWNDLTDLRNGYAHQGMRRQVLVGDKRIRRQLRSIRKYWQETSGPARISG